MIRTYIGLGSNLDNPHEQISNALTELGELPRTQFITASPLYQSSPMGPQDQPDYINAVACIDTELEAHDLLDLLQAIENNHHRIRSRHWGERTLDLDLLLYGSEEINTERLTVPHPFMTERNFVLYPLADIDATLSLPSGLTLQTAIAQCSSEGIAIIQG